MANRETSRYDGLPRVVNQAHRVTDNWAVDMAFALRVFLLEGRVWRSQNPIAAHLAVTGGGR